MWTLKVSLCPRITPHHIPSQISSCNESRSSPLPSLLLGMNQPTPLRRYLLGAHRARASKGKGGFHIWCSPRRGGQKRHRICGRTIYILRTGSGEGIKKSLNPVDIIYESPQRERRERQMQPLNWCWFGSTRRWTRYTWLLRGLDVRKKGAVELGWLSKSNSICWEIDTWQCS